MSMYTKERREAARERAYSLPPKYIQTEEEIAAACEAIQSTWTPQEERSRRPRPKRWTLQQLRTLDFCGG